MFQYTRKVFRTTGCTGEFGTDTGSIQFAEDHSGEGFYFDAWNSHTCESQRFYLSVSDILAIAQIGLISECFIKEQLLEEIPEIMKKNRERDEHLKEMARKRTEMWRPQHSMPHELERDYDEAHRPITDMYADELVGGDGTPEYYAVDGWGVIKLSDDNFGVSFKV